MTTLLRRLGVGGLVIAAVWLVSFVVVLVVTPRGPTLGGIAGVSGDGIYYFVQLESLVRDRDVDYRNNLESFAHNPHVAKQLEGGVATPRGLTPNLFSVGPALLWAPVYVLSLPFSRTAELLAPSIATAVYVLVGLLALYKTLRLLGCTRWVSVASVLGTFVGTNLLYYATFETTMAHGLGFAVVSVLLWLAVRIRIRAARADGVPWLGLVSLGVLGGIAGLVRWQLILVAVPLILFALPIGRRGPHPSRTWHSHGYLRAGALAAGGLLLGLLPQFLIWKALYGSYLVIPQGSGFILPTSPHFGEVLISLRHGLLSWSPLVVLAIIGLIGASLRQSRLNTKLVQPLALTALSIVFLQTYVNGSLLEWWGGDAFGARRFTDSAALFGLGFAWFFTWIGKWRWARVGLVLVLLLGCIANLTLMQFYRTDQISRSESLDWQQLRDAL